VFGQPVWGPGSPTEGFLVRVHALAVAGALALSTLVAAPALASQAAGTQPSAEALQAPKPARNVVATGLGSGTANLRIRVKVHNLPVYADRRVALQAKSCRGCTWHPWASKMTNDRAVATFPVSAPATGKRFYRARVPASTQYRASYSNVLVATRS
jgi:hypothetical protein